MQYSGNRLMSVTDGNSAPMLYDYDADGNRTADGRTGLEFSYNILNLPCEVHDGQQNMQMRYTYLSDGTKVSALDAAGKGHLGNVRSVIDLSGSQNASTASLILEQNDYLPYGTKVASGSQSSLSSNRYRYAGKEEQRIGSFSSQLLDFGARSYDPWTCRWTTVDPLAHKYFGMNPYNYCGNDPVNFFDPDGEDIYLVFDGENNTLFIWYDNDSADDDSDDQMIGSYDAHNNVTKKSQGKWEDGVYEMEDKYHPHTHGEDKGDDGRILDSSDGSYGPKGIFRAKKFKETRTDKNVYRDGMGIHAGRAYKQFADRETNGCIRTTEEAIDAIISSIDEYGPLQTVVVRHNRASANSDKANLFRPGEGKPLPRITPSRALQPTIKIK